MRCWSLCSINGGAYRFGAGASPLLSLRLTHSNNEKSAGSRLCGEFTWSPPARWRYMAPAAALLYDRWLPRCRRVIDTRTQAQHSNSHVWLWIYLHLPHKGFIACSLRSHAHTRGDMYFYRVWEIKQSIDLVFSQQCFTGV